ncbi:MAG: CHAD domain-containing protein [Methylococcaceae bacterium]|nr:CHAD domain-containing protein [Methylococcaceae bacterium]
MTETALSFELPANLAVEKFIAKLSKKTVIELALQQYSLKTFYDSFDWRLYNANLICEFNQSKNGSSLSLISSLNGKVITSTELDDVPAFASEFKDNVMANKLAMLLEVRALLPLTTVDLQIYKINILNREQKTVARLMIEQYDQLKTRLSIQAIKGYDKAYIRLSALLQDEFSLKTAEKGLLIRALKRQGRKPNDYSSKLNLKLTPEMTAAEAVRVIYKTLLKTIKLNEQGTIEDIDSEFLHDFRVAVRKTRSALSQIKAIFPDEHNAYYKEYFAWLGTITGLTRDMDVYLLSFDDYKASLPESMREDLNPLHEFLLFKQAHAQKELANHLKSKKYLTTLHDWELYLKRFIEKEDLQKNTHISIKELADSRIWKVYQQVLNDGAAINEDSPAELLHDLRKTCKKLRYLMEFFQSLYPPEKIKTLIKALKGFQEVLGNFQDYEVQEISLKQFSEEMMQQGTPSNTFLAMGVLVQGLEERRGKARHDFTGRFNDFKVPLNQKVFKFLFAHKSKGE